MIAMAIECDRDMLGIQASLMPARIPSRPYGARKASLINLAVTKRPERIPSHSITIERLVLELLIGSVFSAT